MKKFLLSAHIGLSVLLLTACGGGSKTSSAFISEDIIPMKYAENLMLVKGEGYTEARLRNPWDTTKLLRNYILVEKANRCRTIYPKVLLSARH